MKVILLALSIFHLLIVDTLGQNAIIQNIVNDIQIDSIVQYANEITGEIPVMINGNLETITSRHRSQPGNNLTVDLLEGKLISYGLTPQRQSFSATGENIFVEIPGVLYPNQKFVLCAHFDAVKIIVPAADDNGSGTSTLIEAARILSKYQFEYTIVLAWWDEEEQELKGSAFYAGEATSNNDTLLGVFNMDAIAWDGDDDFLARVHTRPIGNSNALADTVLSVNNTYIGLNMLVNNPGETYSDHASFWDKNISAVLIIEDFDNDGNPHYHTSTDLVQYYNIPYFDKLAKLSIASVATCAIPYIKPIGIGDKQLTRPTITTFNSTIRVQAQGTATIFNLLGQQVHKEELNSSTFITLKGGIYLVRVESDGNSFTKKVYLND